VVVDLARARRRGRLRLEDLAAQQGQSPAEVLEFLDLIRQHELRGGVLLALLAERVDDDAMRRSLTRHAADEVRHAEWWGEVLARLGGSARPSPVGPAWRGLVAELAGGAGDGAAVGHFELSDLLRGDREPVAPQTVRAVLQAVNRIEHEAEALFERLAHAFAPDAAISRRLAAMRDDEVFHLAWVDQLLARQGAAPGTTAERGLDGGHGRLA
jgi:rubrerythrin